MLYKVFIIKTRPDSLWLCVVAADMRVQDLANRQLLWLRHRACAKCQCNMLVIVVISHVLNATLAVTSLSVLTTPICVPPSPCHTPILLLTLCTLVLQDPQQLVQPLNKQSQRVLQHVQVHTVTQIPVHTMTQRKVIPTMPDTPSARNPPSTFSQTVNKLNNKSLSNNMTAQLYS